MAVSRDSEPVATAEIPHSAGGSARLIPAIQSVLADAQISGRELGIIAVGQGPGSFSGLRVGIVAAKALAYAWRTRLLGIETPTCLAWQARMVRNGEWETSSNRLWVVQDAQRGEFFATSFRPAAPGAPTVVTPVQLRSRNDVLACLTAGDGVTGPAADSLAAEIESRGAHLAPAHVRVPHAGQWIDLVNELVPTPTSRSSDDIDPQVWSLRPIYIRPSAAEEKR